LKPRNLLGLKIVCAEILESGGKPLKVLPSKTCPVGQPKETDSFDQIHSIAYLLAPVRLLSDSSLGRRERRSAIESLDSLEADEVSSEYLKRQSLCKKCQCPNFIPLCLVQKYLFVISGREEGREREGGFPSTLEIGTGYMFSCE
jgi:hypothetical protein